MSGVEILSQQTVPIYETNWWLVVGIIVLICVLYFAACLILDKHTCIDVDIDVVDVLVICVVCILLFGFIFTKQTSEYIEYKVTVDDSVSFSAFKNRYEILGEDGKVYTVKEKSDENGELND